MDGTGWKQYKGTNRRSGLGIIHASERLEGSRIGSTLGPQAAGGGL